MIKLIFNKEPYTKILIILKMKKTRLPVKLLATLFGIAVLVPVAGAVAIKLSSTSSVAPNAGTQAHASACEDVVNSIRGIKDPKLVQIALRQMCSQRPDCIYSPERQSCIGKAPTPVQTKCGVNSLSVGMPCGPTTKTTSITFRNAKYTCYNSMTGIVDLGRCATSSELSAAAAKACSGACTPPNPTPTRYPSPTPTSTVKCGVNQFSVAQGCSTPGIYVSAKYVCYDGQSGLVNIGKCTTPDELRIQAERICTSSCGSRITPTPTRYVTPTPIRITPTPIKYPTPTPIKYPTPVY